MKSRKVQGSLVNYMTYEFSTIGFLDTFATAPSRRTFRTTNTHFPHFDNQPWDRQQQMISNTSSTETNNA
jgi:hypothetical protein